MKTFSRIYLGFILLLLYAPILALVVFSFTDSEVFGMWDGFSLDLFRNLLSGSVEEINVALFNTAWILVLVILFSVILGTTAAIGYHYARHKALKASIYIVNDVSMSNPDIVAAVSLFLLYVSLGISRGGFTVLLSQIALCTPFVFTCVLPVLQKMDPEVYEASADLGASLWTTLRRVVIPQIKPGIISGALTAAIVSLDDYAITLFSRGNNGFETLSTFIYADARRGALTPELRPLFSIIVLLMMVLFFFNMKKSKK